jgi:hypothetical protein
MTSTTTQLISIIDTSLTLTISAEINTSLQQSLDNDTLIKVLLSCSILIYLVPLRVSMLVGIARKFTTITLVQLILSMLRLGTGYELCLNISIVIIVLSCMTYISQLYTTTEIPQIARFFKSAQWIYADAVAKLLKESSLQYDLTLLGTIAMPKLTQYMQTNDTSLVAVFATGIAMTWVNLVVQLVLSDTVAANSSIIETVAVLVLGIVMHTFQVIIPGLNHLNGYIEWHINTVVVTTALDAHVHLVDIAIAALALSTVIYTATASIYGPENTPSTITSISNIVILVFTTASSRYLIDLINNMGGVSNIIFIFIIVVALEAGNSLFANLSDSRKNK